jgi:Rod binding domain-containing protein
MTQIQNLLPKGKFNAEVAENLSDSAKKELHKLKKASEEFEGYFIKLILKDLKYTNLDGKSESSMGDFAMDMFRQAISDSMSKTHAMGFADQVYQRYADDIIRRDIAERQKSGEIKTESIED